MEDMQRILESFLAEAFELVGQIDHGLVGLETSPEDLESLNKIFHVAHTVESSSSSLDFDVLARLTHHMEDVLNKARHGRLKITPDIMDVVLESIDRVRTLLNSTHDNGNDTTIGMDIEPICTKLTAISEGESPNGAENETPVETPQKEEPAPTPEPEVDVSQLSDSEIEAKIERLLRARRAEDQARRAQKKQNTTASTTSKLATSTPKAENMKKRVPASEGGRGDMDQTIRVEVKRLDHLMNLIGELVLDKNHLLKIHDDVKKRYEREEFLEELDQVISQLGIITTDVQFAMMKTRVQPIAEVFNKFPRVVRDLGRELGKQIELEITGEEAGLDRSIVEEVGDPITHMIRNSCDHGIEDPAAHAANGKPEKGVVQLKAYDEGNHMVVEIIDDDKGLDTNSLKAKAIEKNLITEREADQMTDKEAFVLIFKPGFSIAAKVTNVSGYDIGMDVVRTNIKKPNEVIEIDSELGKGSLFRLKIPLTLAIIQSLLVGAQGEFYAIPPASVPETIRVPINDIYTIEGKNVLHPRDEVLSLMRLSDVFGVKQALKNGDQIYIVITGVAESKLGTIADTLVGQEKIVIRSMGDYLQDIQGITGATIRSNGRVTPVIDTGAMMDMAKRVKVDIKAQIESGAKESKEGPSDYKVLIVDSSKMDKTSMQKALEPLGVSLIKATNDVKALNIVKSGDHDADAILIDVEMPRVDGYTLAGEIRKYSKYRDLPLVAVTPGTSKTDHLGDVKVGMTEYITKPYSPECLEDVVRKNLKLG